MLRGEELFSPDVKGVASAQASMVLKNITQAYQCDKSQGKFFVSTLDLLIMTVEAWQKLESPGRCGL